MVQKIEDLIIFIDRNAAYFYGGIFEGVVNIKIPSNVMKDLEILDRKALISLLDKTVRIVGAQNNLIVIFSDQALFFKEFPKGTKTKDLGDLEREFYNIVPFNSVSGKLITTQRGFQAVAVNSDLAQVFLDVMESKGFSLEMAIPAFATGLNFKEGLTKDIAKEVFSKREELLKYSLVGQESVPQKPQVQRTQVKKPKQKNSMPMLLGVFGVLLVILVAVALLR